MADNHHEVEVQIYQGACSSIDPMQAEYRLENQLYPERQDYREWRNNSGEPEIVGKIDAHMVSIRPEWGAYLYDTGGSLLRGFRTTLSVEGDPSKLYETMASWLRQQPELIGRPLIRVLVS